MADEKAKEGYSEDEVKNIVKEALAEQAAEAKAAQEKEAELENARLEAFEQGKAEGKKEMETWLKEKDGAPIEMKEAKLGFSEAEQNHAFTYWMRTGDAGAAKSLVAGNMGIQEEVWEALPLKAQKALQEGTGSEGGFLVPDDFVNRITELRDQGSFARAMPVQVIQTSRDAIDVPAESTRLSDFSRTAEEASYTTNDPAFGQNNIVVHKWTKLTRISEELLADDASNLEDFYARAVGRAMAETEANMVANGSGTNQHQGIFVGGDTDALTFDSDTNITPDEIPELLYTLSSAYHNGAAWLMDNDTWRYVISLRDANNWAFGAADMAMLNPAGNPVAAGSLYGKPVYLQDDIPVRATGVGVIAVGHPDYYALVERQGLQIARNPFLYQATGQVGFFSTFRQGGAVLAEEAWAIGQMA